MSEKQVFTLQQVVRSIKKTLEDRYTQTYWVKAEMHKLNKYPSGHAFPELVQKDENKIVAQITGTIWKQQLERINTKFIEVVKEPLREGTTLLLLVKINYSETFGLGLQILDIDPSFSLGELQKQREETLRKLAKEGLLNLNQKLHFPLLPKRVAIISADSSKGLSDFLQVLQENEKSYFIFTHLFNAYLQGDVAVQSIISALKKIKRVKDHFDIVIIVRGGGAEVGMTCYNNYDLCKAIAEFPLPVLTGIGHSTNLNVAEMVSFRNEITPTKLAEFLLQTFREFEQETKRLNREMIAHSLQLIDKTKQDFNGQVRVFKHASLRFTDLLKNELNQQIIELKNTTRYFLKNENDAVLSLKNDYRIVTKEIITAERNTLSLISKPIKGSLLHFFERKESDLEQLEKTVNILNPCNVLQRGYSLTLLNGKILSAKNKPKKGDLIESKTNSLTLFSRVEKTSDNV
ncbi:MAG: exodeoxyribonuclease VII large subunit [Flavobacteriia bacterium]|nr:exodeoxyribonuclease VII large subunit [Flavobacteriia bacterium]